MISAKFPYRRAFAPWRGGCRGKLSKPGFVVSAFVVPHRGSGHQGTQLADDARCAQAVIG